MYEAVEVLALHATVKRKKGQNELSKGQPPKHCRGVVDEASWQMKNFFVHFLNRRTTKVDEILDNKDI